jgi:hypothetical protein
MADRRLDPWFVLLAALFAWAGLHTNAWAGDDGPPDAIPDTDLRTTSDLLRGFNDAELEEFAKQIPRRPEPELRQARPRLVTATGSVYEDRNANGKRDAGEPGLPGVVVSDGEKVIRTSVTGEYRFAIRVDQNPHHRFIVVTRPNGYRPTAAFFHWIPFDQSGTKYAVIFWFRPRRVIALFRDELRYRFLGDWTDRDGNSNIEEKLAVGLNEEMDYDNVKSQRSLGINGVRVLSTSIRCMKSGRL